MKKILSIVTLALFLGASSVFAAGYKPGTYTGKGKIKVPKHSGEVVVKVTVSADRITNINIVKYDVTLDTQGKKAKYGKKCIQAKTQVPAAIIKTQKTKVPVVAKASKTSKAIMMAVEDALKKAKR